MNVQTMGVNLIIIIFRFMFLIQVRGGKKGKEEGEGGKRGKRGKKRRGNKGR